MTKRDETIEFVRRFWRLVTSQRNAVRLIFEDTKFIRSSALLLLAAYLHRARLIYGVQQVTGTYPQNARLEQSFYDTGFFKLLGVSPRKGVRDKVPNPTSKYIQFMSGTELERDASRELREALLGPDIAMDTKARKSLYRAISEAMLNVVQHAYPPEYTANRQVRGRWWLAGHIDAKRDQLLITFCDLGIGIPKTLPKLYAWENIRAALSLLPGISPNDGDMIRAGMLIGRTQTGLSNRGKGLNDLRRFIDLTKGGELRIYSRAGAYRYKPDGKDSVVNSARSIGGTLINWSVPLSEVTNWKPEDFSDVEDETD